MKNSFKPSLKHSAFSLIELSIVILIIGIIVAGVTQSSSLVKKMRLSSVRALTQNSPVSGITNLVLWLETTSQKSFTADYNDGTSLTASSGSRAWLDINEQSIKKNDALSTSNSPYSSNPTYVENGINYLPALSFDGTNDYLDFTDTSFLNNTSYTIFVVEKSTKPVSTPLYNYWLAPKQGTSCSANTCFNMGHQRSPYTIYVSHFTNYLTTTSTEISGLAYNADVTILHSAFFSTAGSRKYFYNGTVGDTDNNTVAMTGNSGLSIGDARAFGGGFYQGLIGEIIVYNKALTKEERWAVEGYLAKKWGIKVVQNG